MTDAGERIDVFDEMVMKAIRRKMDKKKITAAQLIEKGKVNPEVFIRLESGKLSFGAEAMELIKALGMGLDDFYMEKVKSGKKNRNEA